jgi:hypothetical protein
MTQQEPRVHRSKKRVQFAQQNRRRNHSRRCLDNQYGCLAKTDIEFNGFEPSVPSSFLLVEILEKNPR